MIYKSLLFLFLVWGLPVQECSEMSTVRSSFDVLDTEEQLQQFLQVLETLDCKEKTPYLAAATMREGHFTSWPFKKLGFLKEGKLMLESYIKSNPEAVEARFVRWSLQSKMPSFLNYSDNIETDKAFILEHIKTSGLPKDFQDVILEKLNSN